MISHTRQGGGKRRQEETQEEEEEEEGEREEDRGRELRQERRLALPARGFAAVLLLSRVPCGLPPLNGCPGVRGISFRLFTSSVFLSASPQAAAAQEVPAPAPLRLGADLKLDLLPVLPLSIEVVDAGVVSTLQGQNERDNSRAVVGGVEAGEKLGARFRLLFDPQVGGGRGGREETWERKKSRYPFFVCSSGVWPRVWWCDSGGGGYAVFGCPVRVSLFRRL